VQAQKPQQRRQSLALLISFILLLRAAGSL